MEPEPEAEAVAVAATEVTELRDGFYAFSTNESGKCVHMVYNPGIIESGRTTFKIDSNSEITGDEMTATFVTLQRFCEDQAIGEPWDENFDIQGWFPGPTSYEEIYYAFYILGNIIVAKAWGKLYNYTDLLSYLQFFIDSDLVLITHINGRNVTGRNIFYINRVDVHPTKGRGTGLCKPLLRFFLSYLINFVGINLLLIYNASKVMDGLPACYCYLRAGEDNGLELYSQTGERITSENCQELVDEDKVMYYYELPSTSGGGKKRNRKTRKIKRKTKKLKKTRKVKRKTKSKRKTNKTRKTRKRIKKRKY